MKNFPMTRIVMIAGIETKRPAINFLLKVAQSDEPIIYERSRLFADLFGNFIRYVKVGIDILNIFMVLKRFHKAEHLFRMLLA